MAELLPKDDNVMCEQTTKKEQPLTSIFAALLFSKKD